jgi:putative ABC transport system ATP-binding protein
MVPVLIGVVIDRAVSTGASGQLFGWLGVLAVVFAALSSSFRFSARQAERASEQAAHQVRIAVTKRVLDACGGADAGRLPGALVNIATGDAQRVGAVNTALVWGTASLIGIVVAAVALLQISVPLGLLVLLGTPPLLFVAHLVGRPLERRSDVEQDRAAHASGIAVDLVAGLRVLKGIGAESAAISRYHRTSRESLAATLRAARAQSWNNGAIVALTGLFIAAVALLGGRLAADGDISVGGLVAAVGLALFLLTPFETIAWVNGELAQGRASAARVAALLSAPPSVSAGTGRILTPAPGHIRLRGVTYAALSDVDLEVAAGELVGLVTADPAVATALLACLGRDADPLNGSVELDGVVLSTLDPDDVRAAILIAAHDADLFSGTLLENVAAAGSHQLDRALSASAADEVAAALWHGVETPITERGRSLSGGQRQRVALARALAADPAVLVVHDPTTAVDAVTEARIAAGLRALRSGRTTILVTTSPTLLAVTDRVVVFDGGTVTAEASHTELVRDHLNYRAAVLA